MTYYVSSGTLNPTHSLTPQLKHFLTESDIAQLGVDCAAVDCIRRHVMRFLPNRVCSRFSLAVGCDKICRCRSVFNT